MHAVPEPNVHLQNNASSTPSSVSQNPNPTLTIAEMIDEIKRRGFQCQLRRIPVGEQTNEQDAFSFVDPGLWQPDLRYQQITQRMQSDLQQNHTQKITREISPRPEQIAFPQICDPTATRPGEHNSAVKFQTNQPFSHNHNGETFIISEPPVSKNNTSNVRDFREVGTNSRNDSPNQHILQSHSHPSDFNGVPNKHNTFNKQLPQILAIIPSFEGSLDNFDYL